MQILDVELYTRPVGSFAEPEIQVLALASFEEEDVVAVVEFGDFVEVVEFGFGVEFGVFAAVGEHGDEVVEEVALAKGAGGLVEGEEKGVVGEEGTGRLRRGRTGPKRAACSSSARSRHHLSRRQGC